MSRRLVSFIGRHRRECVVFLLSKMIDIYYTFIIVENVLNGIIVLLALIYSATILFVDRFRHVCNLFILNICLSISGSAIFLGIYFTIKYHFKENLFAPDFCILGWLIYALATIDMQFSFISFSLHRYCMVVYHRLTFFKSKTWLVLCIVIQWSFQCVVCLPFIFREKPVRIDFSCPPRLTRINI